jgi:hypothetical protein
LNQVSKMAFKQLLKEDYDENISIYLTDIIDYHGQTYMKKYIVSHSNINCIPQFCNISEIMVYKVNIKFKSIKKM